MSYFITPGKAALIDALESWQWIDFESRKPILMTAFADVFFSGHDGIWFLDTLEGVLRFVCQSREELETIFSTQEGQDTYLLSPLVDRAIRDEKRLGARHCYDFKLHPIVGGPIEYDNIEVQEFMVVLNLRGQLHDQVRDLPVGTKISKFVLLNDKTSKPWWKFW